MNAYFKKYLENLFNLYKVDIIISCLFLILEIFVALYLKENLINFMILSGFLIIIFKNRTFYSKGKIVEKNNLGNVDKYVLPLTKVEFYFSEIYKDFLNHLPSFLALSNIGFALFISEIRDSSHKDKFHIDLSFNSILITILYFLILMCVFSIMNTNKALEKHFRNVGDLQKTVKNIRAFSKNCLIFLAIILAGVLALIFRLKIFSFSGCFFGLCLFIAYYSFKINRLEKKIFNEHEIFNNLKIKWYDSLTPILLIGFLSYVFIFI